MIKFSKLLLILTCSIIILSGAFSVYADEPADEKGYEAIEYQTWKLFWPSISQAEKVKMGMSYSEVTEILGKPQYNFGFGWVRDVYVLNDGYIGITYNRTEEGSLVVGNIIIKHDIWRNFLYWLPNLLITLIIIFVAIILIRKLIRKKQVKKSLSS